jgi:hypothetical protein
VKRKKERIFYNYECTLTGQTYSMTEKAAHPTELVSIQGYYDLHQDKDDRPAIIKKQLGVGQPQAPAAETQTEEE